MSLVTLKQRLLNLQQFIGLRPASAAAGADEVVPALAGAQGGLVVEGAAGGTAIPVSVTGGATEATLQTIAPGDTTALVDVSSEDYDPGTPFTLIVGGKGAILVKDNNGNQVLLPELVDGYIHPGLLTKVYVSASNTATKLVAVY
jgi:hypothetical protein